MTGAAAGQAVGTTCQICRTVPTGDLLELDLRMGDSSTWTSAVWGIFKPPKGHMTPASQRFGALNVGRSFLAEKGYAFTEKQLRDHYRFDVPVIASDPADLISRGIIEAGPRKRGGDMTTTAEQLDPGAVLVYFNRGIRIGNKTLAIVEKRIDQLEAEGKEIPERLLKMLVDLSSKLAVTEASIRARGQFIGGEDDDEGFRSGVGAPSPRIGHARVRIIDGEARPVADEGPADRAHYSERARQEGGEGLPHP